MAGVTGLLKRFMGDGKGLSPEVDKAWAKLVGHSPTLYGLSEDTLTEISTHLEAIPVKAGQEIVRQGDPGDAFYLIVRGTAKVTRHRGAASEAEEVATLPKGFGFGEESLITDAARNATVTMATNGLLVRLASTDFNELLQKPKLTWFSPMQAQTEVERRGAVWLDVRTGRLNAQGTLDGAVSAPLSHVREIMQKMDRRPTYICFCETARQSAAAAYVLSQIGFTAGVLRGGLAGLHKLRSGGLLKTQLQVTAPTKARAPRSPQTPSTTTATTTTAGRRKRQDGPTSFDLSAPRTSERNAPPRRDAKGNAIPEINIDKVWKKIATRSDALNGLSEDTLAEMAACLDPVPVKSGDVIVRQGDEARSCYIIVKGKARVTHQDAPDAPPEQLAKLGPGAAFGEEALLSQAPRNATVTMAGRGLLLRLGGADFTRLLEDPKLTWHSPLQAQKEVESQGAVWLDVRAPDEYAVCTLEGAESLPLENVRSEARKLNRKVAYICICDTSRLSANAAFLLVQRGIDAAVLRGGLQRVHEMRRQGLLGSQLPMTGPPPAEAIVALPPPEAPTAISPDAPSSPEGTTGGKRLMPVLKIKKPNG
ncbi:MAG: cyclic nucleotide-binding domain-containing protein [Lentisphaerae bacterium]|jgi:rhodanese-related sulfurtransferase|nr:cyclic nucleotide-binding domain-containing protein [Lentisphaerota bacterium]MBT7060323.1 cyclic nucleotide-binding domain-containing protein [Lentisphaerota bacterium]MBT7845615.1 cyclic nucleotide-binding domain-containing protein [Lentisphaerota bacterium]